LVEVGDTILLAGPPPGKAGWRIELLGVPPESPQRFATLANVALSSAGREEATVDIAGTRYAADVIDPATGLGVTGGLAVTVIARNALAADELAAAALVLGPQKSRPLLRLARAGAYFRRGTTAVEVNPPPATQTGEGTMERPAQSR
jgi:thiamine biosynthesis lipoprotein ApbE